ncbi:MAG: hypothetical protein IKU59_01045 [Bacteroidales bacterium]|nr:hypothetical protein [Bacteroidales bacterium]MBR5531886.1 hypothetical protein [Bacteroidales bacterium]
MSYIDDLEAKRIILKDKISIKESEFANQYKTIMPNYEYDIVGRISKKLSLITTFSEGARVAITVLKAFFYTKNRK